MINTSNFVALFRNAAPYIRAHQGKTFVLQISGNIITTRHFSSLVHDLALLNNLGIRLVIVFGIRPQVDRLLTERNIKAQYFGPLRITDEASISSVKQAVGEVKIQIEALLSMGLPNSSMAQADIKVSSGNFVTGKPCGVQNGVDLKFTGRVRGVESNAIKKRLEAGDIVLVPPLGYSATGDIFNLSSIEVATRVAIGLKADKLIILAKPTELKDKNGNIIRQLTCEEARQRWIGKYEDQRDETPFSTWALAVKACESGVQRVHFIDQEIDGAVLQELFTRDGVGTLLSRRPFDSFRKATLQDVGGICALVSPLEQRNILVARSKDKIKTDIEHYTVLERDGAIIACGALLGYENNKIMEIACMAVHPAYQKQFMGETLFRYLESLAAENGAKTLFVLTTETTHWFMERGFLAADITSLPLKKRDIYDYQRHSKVLMKHIKQ